MVLVSRHSLAELPLTVLKHHRLKSLQKAFSVSFLHVHFHHPSHVHADVFDGVTFYRSCDRDRANDCATFDVFYDYACVLGLYHVLCVF